MPQNNVIIIGGGLAGLVSALHLSKKGISVTVIEKNSYPKHKVCGEYISNEVLPYLQSLGFNPLDFNAKQITFFELTTPKNKPLQVKLPMGGFGISRYTLDFELAKKAKANGVKILKEAVTDIQYANDSFTVSTKKNSYTAKIVIGAYGKRSNIDIRLNRSFIKKPSPFVAVKAHYKGEFPEEFVSLHNFKGGYCGVSKVENNHINTCYIASYKAFKKHKNFKAFEQNVLYKNKKLKQILEKSEMVFSQPIAISQISFAPKKAVENHMLMCGDTAGMIHPLCGNGMAMGINSAKIASHLIIQYLNNEIPTREILEKTYSNEWQSAFGKRLKMGRRLSLLFKMNVFSEFIALGLRLTPWIVPVIIKKTHGKYMTAIQ